MSNSPEFHNIEKLIFEIKTLLTLDAIASGITFEEIEIAVANAKAKFLLERSMEDNSICPGETKSKLRLPKFRFKFRR